MTDRQAIPYKVHDKLTGDVAYVKAFNRAGARNFHVINRFDVAPLTVAEALRIKPEDIVDGTADPAQQPLPNLDGVQTA